MKKRIFIGVGILAIIIIVSVFYFFFSLRAIGKDENVNFTVESGSTSNQIIANLLEQNLIRNKLNTKIYLLLKENHIIQAGTYSLNKMMNTETIVEKLISGDVLDDSISITFKEGKRLTDYATLIANNFNYNYDDIITKLNDQTFLKTLTTKYWFITDDVLNTKLYYNLEGYLYPDTYTFKKDALLEDIIYKMLDNTENKVNSLKENIENSTYSFHQILTLASIVELEAATESDRMLVAGVFFNRLKSNWSLGSDVTTYYGVKKDFSEELSLADCNACNPYNTRSTCLNGLPLGPISSPSISSINAILNYTSSDYYFFVSDINKKVYFSTTSDEQAKVIATLKSENLWYNY